MQYKDKAELELGPEAESAVGWSRLGKFVEVIFVKQSFQKNLIKNLRFEKVNIRKVFKINMVLFCKLTDTN